MRLLKRLFSIVGIVLLLSVVAGMCGGETESTKASTAPSLEAHQEAAPEAEAPAERSMPEAVPDPEPVETEAPDGAEILTAAAILSEEAESSLPEEPESEALPAEETEPEAVPDPGPEPEPDVEVQEEAAEESKPEPEPQVELEPERPTQEKKEDNTQKASTHYVLNTNTRKFHKPSCSSVGKIKASNKKDYYGDRKDLIDQGYDPCKSCNP